MKAAAATATYTKGITVTQHEKGSMRRAAANGAMDMASAALIKYAGGDTTPYSAWKDPKDGCQEYATATAKLWENGTAKATARLVATDAVAWKNNLGVGATASAAVADARATAGLIDGVLEASAEADVCKARADATATVLGVNATASASVAKASAGISNTPFQASASVTHCLISL